MPPSPSPFASPTQEHLNRNQRRSKGEPTRVGLSKPIIEGIGITTAVLAASYEANDQDAELVADWFRVHPKHVIAAVDFERSLAA